MTMTLVYSYKLMFVIEFACKISSFYVKLAYSMTTMQ